MGLFTPIYLKEKLTGHQFDVASEKLKKMTDKKLLEIAHKASECEIGYHV